MLKLVQAETTSHIEEARELFLEYAESLGFSLCFQSFDKELATLPGDYASPRGRLLLAHWNEEVAGCIALHQFGSTDTCEMKRLYVRPEFRGHYIGRALINAVIAAAREIGYSRMLLDTVAGVHDKAIELYRSYGFREIPPYRENPQPKVLYMELFLASQAADSR